MRRVSTTGRAATGGFTLLEITLAMAVLGMIAAMCYGAFHLGVRAVERGEVAVVTAQRLRVASDVIIRQIKSVDAYCARNEEEDLYPYFMGTATSMTFVTGTGLEGGGGLTRVVYQVVDEPPRLVMGESRFFSRDSLGRERVDEVGKGGTVLLDGFRALKFEYLLSDGVESEWRQAWDGHEDEMLPAAVRILVEGLPGLEGDVWGQEIPVMTTAYGGFTGECDENDEDTGLGATGIGNPNGDNGKQPGTKPPGRGGNEDAADDDEGGDDD